MQKEVRRMNKSSMVAASAAKAIGRLDPKSQTYAASMAKLRRGVGKRLAEAPESWSVVLPYVPDELLSTSYDGFKETEAESAIFTALTLYAVHQQGSDSSVNIQGISFGSALGKLKNQDNELAITRRFNSIVTSSEITELAHHARGLVQLMKASGKNIGLDYPQFAKDLCNFQYPDGRRNVILRWGQDFYRINKDEE